MVKRFEDADYHGSKYGHTLIAGEYRVMNIEVDQGLVRYCLDYDCGWSVVLDPSDPDKIVLEYVADEEEEWHYEQEKRRRDYDQVCKMIGHEEHFIKAQNARLMGLEKSNQQLYQKHLEILQHAQARLKQYRADKKHLEEQGNDG